LVKNLTNTIRPRAWSKTIRPEFVELPRKFALTGSMQRPWAQHGPTLRKMEHLLRRFLLVTALLVLGLREGTSARTENAKDPPHVSRSWRFAGPFAAGKFERDVDVLELPSHGGPPALLDSAASFPSEFVRGGQVGWQSVRAQESGVVDLQQYMGAQAAFGWASGQLTLKTSGCVSVRVSGAVALAWLANSSIALHGVGLQTNLTAGTHRLALKVSGGAFFHVVAAPCPVPRADLAIIKLLPGDWQWGHGKWEEGPPAYDLPDIVDRHAREQSF